MNTNFSNIFRLRRLLSTRSKVIFHVFASLLISSVLFFWEKRWNIVVMAKFKNSEKYLCWHGCEGEVQLWCHHGCAGKFSFRNSSELLRAPRLPWVGSTASNLLDWRENVNNNHITTTRPSTMSNYLIFKTPPITWEAPKKHCFLCAFVSW